MVWINLIVLMVLVGFAVYLKKQNNALTGELASLKEIQTTQTHSLDRHTEMLSSQKEVLEAQKELLAAYRERLDTLNDTETSPAPNSLPPVPSVPQSQEPIMDETLEQSQREKLAEEKALFEKTVQTKKKTMDWYEKEFRVGLDALLELFIHVPRSEQNDIVAKMPASVIKKGFKKLSDCL